MGETGERGVLAVLTLTLTRRILGFASTESIGEARFKGGFDRSGPRELAANTHGTTTATADVAADLMF